jgi:hypothetical protein
MGAFITGNTGPTQAVVKYDCLQIGTSQFNVAIPLFWGQRRMSYNAVWYNNFQTYNVNKGKGAGKNAEYTYSAAVILAISMGVIDEIVNVWANGSTTTTTTLSYLGFDFFDGAALQTPWSYVTTEYPDQALGYSRIAYLANENLNLGSSASVPENAFECVRLNGFSDTLTTAGWTNPTTYINTPGTDVSMADVIPDFLTNTIYGMGFTAADIPDLTAYRQYMDGQGLYFSPLLLNQETAVNIINRWAEATNTWIYWNGSQLVFVPLGDSPVGDYVPDLASCYDFVPTDYIGDPPVVVTRKDPADCHNRTVVSFTDRTLGYVGNSAEYKDQTLVDQYGLRDDSTSSFDEICTPTVATIVAQLLGKRNAYIRNTFTWKASYRFVRLLPGSIVTLTEPNIGLDQFRVRITKVSEDDDLTLAFEAEELPENIGTYYQGAVADTFIPQFPNTYEDPGNVNTPAICEPSANFTGGVPQLLIAASGGAAWGSAQVYAAFNGSTTFSLLGTITTGAAQGVLTADLPDHADPDTVDTLAVDMTESLTEPQPVTHEDADDLRTLSLVEAQPTLISGVYVMPTDGELLSFGNTSTTGEYTADLTYLRRGQLGTAPADHPTGSQFTVIDKTGQSGSTIAFDLPPQYIGTAISFKFVSSNRFGQSPQDISTVNEYSYTPTGAGYGGGPGGIPTVPTGLAGTPGNGQNIISWNANPPTDNVTSYTLYAAPGLGQPFSDAVQIFNGLSTSFTYSGIGNGAEFTYFLTATNVIGTTAPTSGVDCTSNSGGINTLSVTDGTTTVNGAVEIDFTSGATVSSGAGNVAKVAITGGGGGTAYIPLVTGAEPPQLVSDGAGALILVPYSPS